MPSHTPVLDQFNLVVANMDATVAFYTRLGLTIPDTTPEWQQHHRSAVMPGGLTLDFDFDSHEFARVWNRGWQPGHGGGMGVLGFRVRSREAVDQLYAELTGAGYAGQQPPYDAFWGARYAIVSDPDGYAVGLMSPVDANRRTRPTPPLRQITTRMLAASHPSLPWCCTGTCGQQQVCSSSTRSARGLTSNPRPA